ncbi:unnamed protein product [Linum tenue]|uniref:Uncharacterized protein n=1 Tax=Linum tenue TaxID=586396 RepID=A0AAV0S476_9ROSI|nr:unnamed protein product [Linum tenue]
MEARRDQNPRISVKPNQKGAELGRQKTKAAEIDDCQSTAIGGEAREVRRRPARKRELGFRQAVTSFLLYTSPPHHHAAGAGKISLCQLTTQNNPNVKNLAKALVNEEISAFRFDFAGQAKCRHIWREADDLRSELRDLADDKYAIMCVHHDYTPKETTKMDGAVRTVYPRKNWSSMVLYNCGHPKNKVLTPEVVNNQTGAYLHSVLTIHGSADAIVPAGDASEFAKVIPNHKLHIIQGADHGYRSHQTELASVVLEFVKSRLQQQDRSSTTA